MNYYDDYYELDNEDRIVVTDCYCTHSTICSHCTKSYY